MQPSRKRHNAERRSAQLPRQLEVIVRRQQQRSSRGVPGQQSLHNRVDRTLPRHDPTAQKEDASFPRKDRLREAGMSPAYFGWFLAQRGRPFIITDKPQPRPPGRPVIKGLLARPLARMGAAAQAAAAPNRGQASNVAGFTEAGRPPDCAWSEQAVELLSRPRNDLRRTP